MVVDFWFRFFFLQTIFLTIKTIAVALIVLTVIYFHKNFEETDDNVVNVLKQEPTVSPYPWSPMML